MTDYDEDGLGSTELERWQVWKGHSSPNVLPDFLLARIAEDVGVARAATPGPWNLDSVTYAEALTGPDGDAVVAGGRWGGEAPVFDSTETATHIARFDPARILAESETKRRIIEEVQRAMRTGTSGLGPTTLRLLALPYADHPDYDRGWKIELGR